MSDAPKSPRRSTAWFGGSDRAAFLHRSWMKGQGHPDDMFDGRPIIGICNTWSDLTPCNAHFRALAERIKRGVYEAGGFPVEFPVSSLGEPTMRPTTMLFRNLVSMDVEEAIRAHPIDGVVLMVGCDKTTPALMMGAASCDLPTLVLSGGPMLNGKFRGHDIGSGTDVFRFMDALKTGDMLLAEVSEAESGMTRSIGHCMTMGTASSMASMVEAIGMGLPDNATIPAADTRRWRLAQLVGRRIVGMVEEDLTFSKVVDRRSIENAIRVNAALGGSTNAVLHLLALAGRLEIDLTLDDWDRLGRDVPTIVNLKPSGDYLMEDFYYAGGIPGVIRRLGEAGLLHRDAATVNGRTIWENNSEAPIYNEDVIRPFERSLMASGGVVVLRGNIAENGAIMKPSAATPRLSQHRGRAIVFDSIEEYRARIDDPELDIDADSIMVLRNCGPTGYPGMPEVGNMGLPAKLLRQGVKDMVRISDARMSGTAYGTVILHCAPEAAVGGGLALVQEGDIIEVDVANRRLHLDVAPDVLEQRRAAWTPPAPGMTSGYQYMHASHVLQADRGADLDFLVGRRGAAVPREST
ncbi:IlvD/Edd family dehydratase [Sphingobium quisquiliarum]|nr:IlvD/Edd family dehydratase [Sphingobium quisquiliarum]